MGFIETPSVVLRSSDFGESDRIVAFLTREHGRVRALAKGAKVSRKRFGWNLEPLSVVRLRAWESASRGLLRIDSCELVKPFGTSGDLAGFAAGSYVVELLESHTGEGAPSPGVFDLTVGFLGAIEARAVRPDDLRIFELRLLAEAGYSPGIESCIGCALPRASLERALFQPDQGTILCDRCARAQRSTGYSLSRGSLETLACILAAGGGELWNLAIPAASARECARMLPGFLARLAGKEIRSLKFLRDIWPEGIPD